jgi:uncharacterized protein (DUF1810 family)
MLGARLAECTDAVLCCSGKRSAERIFGIVDAMKLRSSMTLFAAVADDAGRFGAVLDAFYGGQRDFETIRRL